MELIKSIDTKEILKRIEKKDLFARYAMLIIGLLIFSIAYNAFLVPNNLLFGGTTGVAIILKEYIDPSLTILFISILSLIIMFLFVGKRETVNSVVGAILFPLFTTLTKDINLPISNDDIMLTAICGAVLIGFANGIIGRTGLGTGGIDPIIRIIEREFKLSNGTAYLIVNGIIVIIGAFTFGWRIFLYALIILYIISIVQDKVILSISMNKTFFIVTSEVKSVKAYLMDDLSRGVTVLDAKGGFTNFKEEVIMVVIPTREYFKVKNGILEIDPDAFITICDSYQVYGQDSHRKIEKEVKK